MARKQEILTIEGKKFRLNEVDSFTGRRIALRYDAAKENNYEESENLMRLIFSFVEVEVAEGKWVKLDNDELIKQHVSTRMELEIEGRMLSMVMGFSLGGEK